MADELPNLFSIQTDHVMPVNSKRRRDQGNRQQFESHLGKDGGETPHEEEAPARETADVPSDASGAQTRRHTGAHRGRVIDFEA